MKRKAPAFQFYPGDWQRDLALRSCSLAARGLWIELMCLMHDGQPRGVLRVEFGPLEPQQIAKLVAADLGEVEPLLAELEAAGVFSCDSDGAIYSRRMVSDEEVRRARADGGQRGAEHGQKGAEHGVKGGRPRRINGDEQPPSIPPSKRPPAVAVASSLPTHLSRLGSQGGPAETPGDGAPGAAAAVVGEDIGSGSQSRRPPYEPQHPRTVELVDHLAVGIRSWKPDARIAARSDNSLREMDRLFRLDGRAPDLVGAVLTWLFGGEDGDYQPEPGSSFDWRPNIGSGASLRKSWDKLETVARAKGALS